MIIKQYISALLLVTNIVGFFPLPVYAQESSDSAQQVATDSPTLVDFQDIHITPTPTTTSSPTPTFTLTPTQGAVEDSARIRGRVRLKQLAKHDFRINELISLTVENGDLPDVQVQVFDPIGKSADIYIDKLIVGSNLQVTLQSKKSMRPGKYTLMVTSIDGVQQTQDFTWGVLAINTNRSIYTPGETGRIDIAVLNPEGKMVCDAEVTLSIMHQESKKTDTLSTRDGTIIVTPDCKKKEDATRSDYEATYQFDSVGAYSLALEARTAYGVFQVTDAVHAQTNQMFEIERTSTTRIFPPRTYPMTIIIKANEDFSGTVVDYVPKDFAISPLPDVQAYASDSAEILTHSSEASLGLAMPFEGNFVQSLGFSEQLEDPLLKDIYKNNNLKGHDGLDFAMPIGTPIIAVDDGIVVLAGKGAYGTTIVIDHAWGRSYYGHLNTVFVEKGKSVEKGENIARSGNTGLTTGPHLHFGIKPKNPDMSNGYFGKIDPAPRLTLKTSQEEVRKISWVIDMKKGETIKVGYQFITPSVSPQFYLIGPLEVQQEQSVVTRELREWQLAIDAANQYSAVGGTLVTGAEVATSQSNTGSWKGALGTDSNFWSVTRANPGGLDQQLYFDGVTQSGANKLLVSVRDANVSVGDAYAHQICDWVSSTGVDTAAGGNCTTGGWRTIDHLKGAVTLTGQSSSTIEIFDGYFWNESGGSPGTVISTPISNFITGDSNKRVLIRVYSTVNSTTRLDLDSINIELAIDPHYEVNNFTKISPFAGATTNYPNYLTGNADKGSDGNKFVITNDTTNPLDVYFSFTNVETYTGANTIFVRPEICVSNTALTFDIYIRNFNSSSWEALSLSTITGSACGTDTEYALAKNNVTLSNYISSGEVRIRFATATSNTHTFQLDRLYLMVGSTNTDSSLCEISWGTGTATNCTNTRDVADITIGTADNTNTFQITSAAEYPSTFYSLDNDDDTTDGEVAVAGNVSFPVTISAGMAVTGVVYAFRAKSGASGISVSPGIRDYSGITGTSGWVNSSTAGSTDYGYVDAKIANSSSFITSNPEDYIDTTNNRMNVRMRTSASTDSTTGDVTDWDFAMVSIRWIEETNRITTTTQFSPSGGNLVTGAEVATGQSNTGSYKGAMGNDSNYWSTTRANPGGLDKQIYFDGVVANGANKIIIKTEDKNVSTADAYVHQICDWVSSTGVDNAAGGNCTTGGWRTLNLRKVNFTSTADAPRAYEIYNGFFWDRSGASPGTLNATPISNFITSDANKRVLLRVYSTVASTVQHDLEYAQIELAIDPWYEPQGFTKNSPFSGATSNYISDLIGPVSNESPSDGTKFVVTNDATNALDVYFSFTNVDTYTGANTIVVKSEICVSNTALTFDAYIRNFNSSSWEALTISTVTGSSCGTDTEYIFAKNNVTLSNYISSGEVRIRFATATLNTHTMQFDRIFMLLGSTNSDSSLCEISWGTGTATDCTNTRDVADVTTGTTDNTNTFQITSTAEYPSTFYGTDNDDDGVDSEVAVSGNISFPITLSSGMAITALHGMTRARSNSSTFTPVAHARDYSGTTGGSGWSALTAGSLGTTNYGEEDTWTRAELQSNPDDYVDTVNNRMNMRFRTNVSTDTTTGDVADWDFAIMSMRWVEVAAAGGTPTNADLMRHGNWWSNNVEQSFTF